MMSAEQIKKELKKRNYKFINIARHLNISGTAIHQVVNHLSTSHRIRCCIAELIDKPVQEIFDVRLNIVESTTTKLVPASPGRPMIYKPTKERLLTNKKSVIRRKKRETLKAERLKLIQLFNNLIRDSI